jgi:nitrogen regulatory protein PII 2
MKEVIAVIRMNMMNKTKQALAQADIASFTARKVMGRGKGKVDFLLLKGAEEGYDEAIRVRTGESGDEVLDKVVA